MASRRQSSIFVTSLAPKGLMRSEDREVAGRNEVNGKITPKSIVIGVADPVALRGRQNLRPAPNENYACESLDFFVCSAARDQHYYGV